MRGAPPPVRLALVALALLAPAAAADGPPGVQTGTVRFDPGDDPDCPECYRLPPRQFRYELAPRYELRHAGVDVFDLRFPSPAPSGNKTNDTVHAEYYRPKGVKRGPAAVVLDIMDGQQVVSRGQAVWLAQTDIPALVVILPYYGPRRPPGSRTRLVSANVEHSVAAIRQAVLDCRCATAWLAARPEVDPGRLGIVGTSLGSFMAALTAAAEPRLHSVCLLLGGGGLVDAYADHPRARPFAWALALVGGTDRLKRMIAPVDPLTYADRLKARKLLLVAASRDDVVPPAAASALWAATGRQPIVWLDATHVGAAVYAFPAMNSVVEHLKRRGE